MCYGEKVGLLVFHSAFEADLEKDMQREKIDISLSLSFKTNKGKFVGLTHYR